MHADDPIIYVFCKDVFLDQYCLFYLLLISRLFALIVYIFAVDTVFYIHSNSARHIAKKFTKFMVEVTAWLSKVAYNLISLKQCSYNYKL